MSHNARLVVVAILSILVGVVVAVANAPVARIFHPLDPAAHLVKFRDNDAVWLCLPATPTEAK